MPDFFNTDFITFNIFHLFIFAFLFFAMLIYFKIAKKYNIIDESGRQSSHNYITIKGGGIVFWLAGVLFSLLYLPQSLSFLIGITLICGISFWSDISSLSASVRLIVQFVAVGLILFDLDMYYLFPWWAIVIIYIACVGIINAYNFMDGINGMTGLYSLVILGSLQYVNQNVLAFVHPDFIIYVLLACVVFLLLRGIGSIGIAFWIIVLLLKLILETDDVIWILFLAVYGVDVVCTIGHRVYLKQNILKPHRLHFYQVWVEKAKCPQLWVSVAYAAIQLIICIVVIYFWKRIPEIMLSLTLLGLLVALYELKFQYDLEDLK